MAHMLEKANKKALIVSEERNIRLVNFLANGLNYVNNPRIQFMKLDEGYLSNAENIRTLIDQRRRRHVQVYCVILPEPPVD